MHIGIYKAKSLARRILDLAIYLTNAEAIILMLNNQTTKRPKLELAVGMNEEVQEILAEQPDADIVSTWVRNHNEGIISNRPGADVRLNNGHTNWQALHIDSGMAAPIRAGEDCIGTLSAINKKEKYPFLNKDIDWLTLCADMLASTINTEQQSVDTVDTTDNRLAPRKHEYHRLIQYDKTIRERLELAKRIAKTDATIMVTGESGVGKELFVEQIHLHSWRHNRPLVCVNCLALPETLLESELFGHVRGAFTDAYEDRAGKFELADGGTLFLDEVTEMSLQMQAKLLRVLQYRTFEKLGSNQQVHVDVRVIAASNRDLRLAVEQGRMRADLYYRLNVIPLHIPPLRECPNNIPALAKYFLQRHNSNGRNRELSDKALQALLSYSWPGNVRELENVIERAVVMSTSNIIEPSAMLLGKGMHEEKQIANEELTLKEYMHNFKRNFIVHILEANGWNQTKTAHKLGIQRTYLSRLIRQLKILRPAE